MTQNRKVLIGVILIWALLFAASFFFSTRIEGPQNIDTGFRRLDVLARFQAIALSVAIASAILGILWRKTGRRMMLMGFAPLLATVAAVAGIAIVASIFADRPDRTEPQTPRPSPTQPVDEASQ